MPRSIVASTLGSLLLLANPTMGMTGWWTWSEYSLTPHFAFQDPGSGDLVHTACNSNGSAVFPTDEMHKFPIKAKPKPATALAVVGWYDDELRTTVASVFFQARDGSLVNADVTCNWKTGDYELQEGGEYKVSEDASAPSIHEDTGLAVVELGDSGGNRVFYHDEDGRVNVLAYDDDTDWVYIGPVSQLEPEGKTLGAARMSGTNMSVIFPYDTDNFAIAGYKEENKDKWSLSSLPLGFKSPTPTNKTATSKYAFDWSKDVPFILPEIDMTTVSVTLASNEESLTNIFYVGTDSKLHQVTNGKDGWELAKDPGEKKWPKAGDKSARLALVAAPESEELWIFYRNGKDVMELHLDEYGTWADAKKVSSVNENAPTSDDDDEDDNEEEEEGSTGSSNSNHNNDGETSESSSGLSTGAKAGIGVGVSLGALAAAGAIFMVIRRRRRSNTVTQQDPMSPDQMHQEGYRAVNSDKPAELPIDQGPHELPTNEPEYELLGDTEQRRLGSRTGSRTGSRQSEGGQDETGHSDRTRENRDGGANV
ncbi:uncharacterized protein NECHADRAFT_82851 [Fusarium vanettenii 77-13-4]|uniref:Fucose-specific lectin n=1 Tax=Fusarium vanettenii (strain ATCC MYA-4622 / CBS 123669 / FGSC 9596 / NRRL 45880 / 77-13-4) TaxID=660122 RepID=C7YX08_FUSV7|nr:uncharacterized protein NECHADRAFT_82851 [Fusarium vanettenii 77-13-4]EEU43747.1 hypothetical protein NECHADRAFT_82851 [Fusarium vanettenii 77-13-4]